MHADRAPRELTKLKRCFATADTHEMDDDRPVLGLLIAALGAAVLAISVFLPWYGVSLTASGSVAAQQELATVAQQFGNATFQKEVNNLGAEFSSVAGRQIVTVSAHQTLKHVSLIILLLAGIALLASLFRLADLRGALFATGGQIALAGGLAAGVVLVRLLWRPGAGVQFISVSPSWGIWLALLSAGAIVSGGLLAGNAGPRTRPSAKHGPGPPPLGLGRSPG